MADFADPGPAALDVELLPAVAARLSPALPAGEQLLEHNLYAVCAATTPRRSPAKAWRSRR